MSVVKISTTKGVYYPEPGQFLDFSKEVVNPIDGSALDDFRCIADACVEDSNGDTEFSD